MNDEARWGRLLGRLAVVVVLLCVLGFVYLNYNSLPCSFDDAYMFIRYANNILAGHGHAWNPGGPQAFGSTNLPQLGVVTLLRLCLPGLTDSRILLLSSAIAGTLLAVVLVLACARLATSPPLARKYAIWTALVVPPLILQESFKYLYRSGMGTMLSALGIAVLIWLTMRLVAKPKPGRLAAVVAAAYFAYLIRPDNGIYATLFPFLCILLLVSGPRWKLLTAFTVSMVCLVLVDLAVKKWLLGTALPLPFYAKQHGVYDHYTGTEWWNPIVLMRTFFSFAISYVCVIVFFAQRRMLKLLIAFFVPVVLTFAYYLTVNQIMGFEARFYYPSLPFFVIAAGLVLDEWFLVRRGEQAIGLNEILVRLIVLWLVVGGGRQATYSTYLEYERLMAKTPVHSKNEFHTVSDKSLPHPKCKDAMYALGTVLQQAPPGMKIAVTEYGVLGAMAPEAIMIDMVGLHNRDVAMNGFSAERIFADKPDLIWMPHPHYTGMLRDIYDRAEFWNDYVYYPKAWGLGLAIRKDSPLFDKLMPLIEARWELDYPGLKMEDYRAELDHQPQQSR